MYAALLCRTGLEIKRRLALIWQQIAHNFLFRFSCLGDCIPRMQLVAAAIVQAG